MNKKDFLSRLSTALASLPPEERKAAMDYYEEFFTEAGEENEQSVIAEFGSPEELAKSIIEENNVYNPANNGQNNTAEEKAAGNHFGSSGFDQNSYNQSGGQFGANTGGGNYGAGYIPPVQQNQSRSGGQTALIIVLVILGSPFILGILGILVGIVVTLLALLVSLIVALGVCTVVFAISGIVAFLTDPALAVMLIGIAFICAGLFPLAVYPLCKAAAKGIDALVKWISGLFRKNKKGKEMVQ